MTDKLDMYEDTMLLTGGSRGVFLPGFVEWFDDPANVRFWRRFKAEADKIVATGRNHSGSRRIIEVLRYETLAADADEDYKINNNTAPDLGRFYMLVTGNDIFETRGR